MAKSVILTPVSFGERYGFCLRNKGIDPLKHAGRVVGLSSASRKTLLAVKNRFLRVGSPRTAGGLSRFTRQALKHA